MSINQHVVFGTELKDMHENVSAMLSGGDYEGVVPKKVGRKLEKINKYLTQILQEMGDIASRQHPELDAPLLKNLYSRDSGKSNSRERQG